MWAHHQTLDMHLIQHNTHIHTQQEHLSDLLNLQQTPDGDNDNNNNDNDDDDGDDVFYLITVNARSSHFSLWFLTHIHWVNSH